MPTRAVHIVIDATDPSALAAFWAAALGWEVAEDEPDEVVVWPSGFSYPNPAALPLVFVPVPEPKVGKNRLHLDLATTSEQHQAAEVERMLALGATRADIGQGIVPFTVLADPEGNEFCVLDPREEYLDARPVAAIVLDCHRPDLLLPFWADATGWDVHRSLPEFASLRAPGGTGPYLELLQTPDAKTVKNRLHVDVAPPADGDVQAEARRLEQAGAVRLDIGQGEATWVVLGDPEENEFCVLSPR
jgi:catechol 2,3-dioxygenase-like lactoylglutathione lyase family enzyme